MVSLQQIQKWLFFIGLFFIPFNSFSGVEFFGEFRNESAAYFFMLGFAIWILEILFRSKINFPFTSFLVQILLLFLIWCFLSFFFNFDTIIKSYFKHTTGVNRFIRQFGSLLISAVFFFSFYWSVLSRMNLKKILVNIRNVFTYSLIFASFYSFFEILVVVYNLHGFEPLMEIFNYFPFLEVDLHQDRISSISYEPPFLAIYLITIAGWMFSYIITSRGLKKFVPTILVLILTYYSGSRTAMIVIGLQFLIFLGMLSLNLRYIKYVFILLFAGFIGIGAIISINPDKVIDGIEKKINSLNFKSNLMESVSNKSRLGIQYASLQVVKKHPIIGVGYGQQTYHNRFEYPSWATVNNYEFELNYENPDVESFPPGYNLYIRILTETGIIGLSIFLLFLLAIFYSLSKIYKYSNDEKKILSIILFISFVGFVVNFLQIDTFRLYGFWINVVILIKLIQNFNKLVCDRKLSQN